MFLSLSPAGAQSQPWIGETVDSYSGLRGSVFLLGTPGGPGSFEARWGGVKRGEYPFGGGFSVGWMRESQSWGQGYVGVLGEYQLLRWKSLGVSGVATLRGTFPRWGLIPGLGIESEVHTGLGQRVTLGAEVLWDTVEGVSLQLTTGFRIMTPTPLPLPSHNPTLVVEGGYFSPDGDGVDDVLHLKLQVDNPQYLARWSLRLEDVQGHVLLTREGTGAPPETWDWNGKQEGKGLIVDSAADYRWFLDTWNIFGRKEAGSLDFVTDILVIVEGDRSRIRIPYIEFQANSPELTEGDTPEGRRNKEILEKLSRYLNRFPAYRYTIVGHGNIINWKDRALSRVENDQEVKPLTLKRADAVYRALVHLGVDGSRMTVVGRGGDEPLVPFGGSENWRNRRVEILVIK